MQETGKKSFSLTSGQARRAARFGHPELSVECPKCHAAVGRTCFMPPGILGVTHTVRKMIYERQRPVPPASTEKPTLLRNS